MSVTMERLKKDHLAARKAKDQISMALLGTLISEASMVGKSAGNRDSTEDEVLATTRKFLKNAEETSRLLGEQGATGESVGTAKAEIEILKQYLPQMMSVEELNIAVAAILVDKPDAKMGDVMGALKAAHNGLYDGKVASTIIKQRLTA